MSNQQSKIPLNKTRKERTNLNLIQMKKIENQIQTKKIRLKLEKVKFIIKN